MKEFHMPYVKQNKQHQRFHGVVLKDRTFWKRQIKRIENKSVFPGAGIGRGLTTKGQFWE